MGGLIELLILGGLAAGVIVVLTKINGGGSGFQDRDDTGMLSDLSRRSWSSDGSGDALAASVDRDGDGIPDSQDIDDGNDDDGDSDSGDSGSSDD